MQARPGLRAPDCAAPRDQYARRFSRIRPVGLPPPPPPPPGSRFGFLQQPAFGSHAISVLSARQSVATTTAAWPSRALGGLREILPTLAELRLSDFVDIAIVAAILWLVLAWFRTTRARMALLGLSAFAAALSGGTWLGSATHDLAPAGLLSPSRRWCWWSSFKMTCDASSKVLRSGGCGGGRPIPLPDVERTLVGLCFRLAKSKIGALIVLPGREPLERHLEGGVHLAGRLSEPLLLSLFDTGSPGHDGAVVVRGSKVVRFGVHLPLSTDWDRIGHGGTRHAAALGLAERSDAFCLVVSEERGEVSLAHAGTLRVLAGPEELLEELAAFIQRFSKRRTPQRPADLLGKIRASWREGVMAAGLAAGLWYVAISGAAVETAQRSVSVVVQNLPEGYELVSVEPSQVNVRFTGRRRDLYLAGASDMTLRIDALLVQLGRRTFELSLDQVRAPEQIQPISLDPTKVILSVKKNSTKKD